MLVFTVPVVLGLLQFSGPLHVLDEYGHFKSVVQLLRSEILWTRFVNRVLQDPVNIVMNLNLGKRFGKLVNNLGEMFGF